MNYKDVFINPRFSYNIIPRLLSNNSLKMSHFNARSVNKNMSRAKRSFVAKNTARVEAAISNSLNTCTYGKVSKALGNKMFLVIDSDSKEHLSYIRGKLPRIEIGSIVLLNIRDYESRAESHSAVYDIMALFTKEDASRLVKNAIIPSWMTGSTELDDEDLFDYQEDHVCIDII